MVALPASIPLNSPEPAGSVAPQQVASPADIRFRTLIGETAWAELPEPVRRRFSKRLSPGETVVYRGAVVATQLTRAGRMLAFVTRVIGAPLPLTDGATGPATVIVAEDAAMGGQSWLRIYARPGQRPQAIHSCKRFSGPTGLEEYIGYGIGMSLRVSVEERALLFRSSGYFLALGRWRWNIPSLLQPGRMCIVHRDEGAGTFSFSLEVEHALFGVMVRQVALFADDASMAAAHHPA